MCCGEQWCVSCDQMCKGVGGGEMSLNSYCGLIDCWHSIGRVLSASNNDEPHMKI